MATMDARNRAEISEVVDDKPKDGLPTENSIAGDNLNKTPKQITTEDGLISTDNEITTKETSLNENRSSPISKPNIGQIIEAKTNMNTNAKTNPVPGQANALEQGYYKNFLNPMLAEMQSHVKKNEEILDRINKQLEEDRDARRIAKLTAHIPEPLKGEGQEMSKVFQSVENMIVCENFDEETAENKIMAKIAHLDEHSHAAVLSHSLAAHISTLDFPHLKKLANKISADCELWLSRLFRFKEGSVIYHDDPMDGLVKVCRLALHQKFSKYATEGFEALYSRPPVIYISAAATRGLGHYLCSQLGLPLSCLCTVPCNAVFGASQRMDVAVLEKLILDDVAAAKTPVLMVAYAGTPVTGHVDNLSRLEETCKKHTIWLHVEGNHLATLAMFSVPTSVEPARSGDSITLTPSKWLGIPGLPNATLYRKSDPALAHTIGLNTFNPKLKLSCLPLWVCLQSLGHQGILNRIKHSCDLAKAMFDKLNSIPSIKQVTKEKKKEEENTVSVMDLISKAIEALLVFKMVSPIVVFRYVGSPETPGTAVAQYSVSFEQEEKDEKQQQYLNALNTWLWDVLQADNPLLHLEMVDVDREGVCVRFSPLDSGQALAASQADIDTFFESVKSQIAILDATVSKRESFTSIATAENCLRIIDLSTWAGLGIVQYVPITWQGKLGSLPEQGKKEINNINAELVHRLKASDAAFSLGETEDNLFCVRFGMITDNTDIEELIAMVYTVGGEVEAASKYLEHMSEVVLKSIEDANKELRKESDDKLLQEGVLRQVPIVGSLLNWWSPTKDLHVKGRSFNLHSGQMKSTEITYKYHMQVQEEETAMSDGQEKSGHGTYKEKLRRSRESAGSSSLPGDDDSTGVSPNTSIEQDEQHMTNGMNDMSVSDTVTSTTENINVGQGIEIAEDVTAEIK